MNIVLDHTFLSMCYDLEDLLSGNRTISDFVKKLQKQSKLHPNRHDPQTYLGDGFELLIEALIKLSPMDNRIGVSNYQNAPYGEAGIDGFGVGSNGHPAAVQIKFKSDLTAQITESKDNIAGFGQVAHSSDYNVRIEDAATNLLVVTYGAGVNRRTVDHFFRDGVKVLSRAELKQLVDNNCAFWDALFALGEPWF